MGHLGSEPLALRWTGVRWRRTPLPLPDGTRLGGVSAVSAHDAWIVGTGADGNARTVRWDGRSWRPGALPGSGGKPITANSVAARTRSDVWAVGSSNGFAGSMAVAWHYAGRSWSVTPVRSAPGSTLRAVAADARDDAWAVGVTGNRQLLLHWNGRSWSPTPPPQSAPNGTPVSVAAIARDSVWAVGATPSGAPLIEHWDGHGWSLFPAPLPGGHGSGREDRQAPTGATAVVTDGARGVWISGMAAGSRPYLAHFNGMTWDVSRPPLPRTSAGDFASVNALTHVPHTREVRTAGAYRRRDSLLTSALTWTNAPRPR
ncbi:hypothetical protein [Actinomadura logoneensis]|uniref:hypothetical protein n=1 Tax=Actinomadura logoneensis TaxID=2293572 RepID=UPI0011C18C08|nr:hypothetical protein [Actinomadura logoneensis]